jgi:hypothetical protein
VVELAGSVNQDSISSLSATWSDVVAVPAGRSAAVPAGRSAAVLRLRVPVRFLGIVLEGELEGGLEGGLEGELEGGLEGELAVTGRVGVVAALGGPSSVGPGDVRGRRRLRLDRVSAGSTVSQSSGGGSMSAQEGSGSSGGGA